LAWRVSPWQAGGEWRLPRRLGSIERKVRLRGAFWRWRAASNPTMLEYAENVGALYGSEKGTRDHDPEVIKISL
jgi:hypothetical protein